MRIAKTKAPSVLPMHVTASLLLAVAPVALLACQSNPAPASASAPAAPQQEVQVPRETKQVAYEPAKPTPDVARSARPRPPAKMTTAAQCSAGCRQCRDGCKQSTGRYPSVEDCVEGCVLSTGVCCERFGRENPQGETSCECGPPLDAGAPKR